MSGQGNLKLLVLTRYSRLGASSRLRTFQFEEYLRAAGIDAEYSSFFDDAYLQNFYGGGTRRNGLTTYLSRRWKALSRASRYDCIWLEKEALPWVPFAIEGRLWPKGVPVVSDFDDAIFHRYDRHPNPVVRAALGSKIDRVMESSRIVFAGNRYLAERAQASGARVELIPTVVPLARYRPREPAAAGDTVRVAWIGTPSTWLDYVVEMAPAIVAAAGACGGKFFAIGGGEAAAQVQGVEVVAWSEEREVEQIRSMDIGIMPLVDTPFARGKCGYKLIQYMACGLPVIASPVGVNREIVEHGVNGYFAQTEEEWRDAIVRLASDRDLRACMGAAGRQKIAAQFSAESLGPRIANLITAAAQG